VTQPPDANTTRRGLIAGVGLAGLAGTLAACGGGSAPAASGTASSGSAGTGTGAGTGQAGGSAEPAG